jgi:hypothetical protein
MKRREIGGTDGTYSGYTFVPPGADRAVGRLDSHTRDVRVSKPTLSNELDVQRLDPVSQRLGVIR